MPRLTFEALMAPGGLMDAGSRLTQTLIETPFKREQLRQGIREQEIGRAEQKKLRADTIAREDTIRADEKATLKTREDKGARIGYYKDQLEGSRRDAEQARAKLIDLVERRIAVKMKGAGASDESIKHATTIVAARLSNATIAEQLTAANVKALFKTAVEAIRENAPNMPGVIDITQSSDINGIGLDIDDNLKNEYEYAMQRQSALEENYRKEVGAAENTLKARAVTNQLGLNTPADPTAPVRAPGAPVVRQAGEVQPGENPQQAAMRKLQEARRIEDRIAAGGAAPVAQAAAPNAEPSTIPFEDRSRGVLMGLQGTVPGIAADASAQADILAAAKETMKRGKGTPGGDQDKAVTRAATAIQRSATADPRVAATAASVADLAGLTPAERAVYDQIVATEFGPKNFMEAQAGADSAIPTYLQGSPARGVARLEAPSTWFTGDMGATRTNDANMALIQAPLLDIARRARIQARAASTGEQVPAMVAYNPLAR